MILVIYGRIDCKLIVELFDLFLLCFYNFEEYKEYFNNFFLNFLKI